MLRPIPKRILRTTAIVKACAGTDRYENPTYESYLVRYVHLQPTDRIIKSVTNTDEQLSSILFVDCRYSKPNLNWKALFDLSHQNGGDLKVVIREVTYTVKTVDGLRDDTDNLHHWEIGLV